MITKNQIVQDIINELGQHLNETPKTIFMSEKLRDFVASDIHLHNDIRYCFGIPLQTFESDKYEWWLSWCYHNYKTE